jgi:hypothetical protein
MMGELTGKQEAFVKHYITNGFNGTRAARSAGYGGDDNSLAVIAHDNLRNAKIRAEIDVYFAELHMTSDEVLGRLADMARADVSHFLNDDGSYDLTTDDARKHLYLVKKSKVRMRHGTNAQTGQDWEEVETEIELHDPRLTDEQRIERVASILDTARARRDRQVTDSEPNANG